MELSHCTTVILSYADEQTVLQMAIGNELRSQCRIYVMQGVLIMTTEGGSDEWLCSDQH